MTTADREHKQHLLAKRIVDLANTAPAVVATPAALVPMHCDVLMQSMPFRLWKCSKCGLEIDDMAAIATLDYAAIYKKSQT